MPGFPGETGSSGAPGQQGRTGSTGHTGSRGNMGLTGATGIQGDTGSPGLRGITGWTGATGPMGPTGFNGLPGTPGIKGITGATGRPGGKGDTGTSYLFIHSRFKLSNTTKSPTECCIRTCLVTRRRITWFFIPPLTLCFCWPTPFSGPSFFFLFLSPVVLFLSSRFSLFSKGFSCLFLSLFLVLLNHCLFISPGSSLLQVRQELGDFRVVMGSEPSVSVKEEPGPPLPPRCKNHAVFRQF